MYETDAEVQGLQELIDASYGRATDHLRGIIHGACQLSATDIVALMTGMKVLSLGTVTAAGEPRVSAVDGHFLHGRWTFSTDGSAAKARHLRARPVASAAHIDNEELAVFCHGRVEELSPGGVDWDVTLDHWARHYGASPLSWGDDIRIYRLQPSWMVGYIADRDRILAQRGAVSGGIPSP